MIFFLISFLKLWAISGLKKSGGTFLIISDINTGRNKKFNETKSWFFENWNKIDKPLARHMKEKKKAQINKIRNEKEIRVNTLEIQRIIRDFYKQLYTKKNGQPRRNGQIIRKVHFPKTKPRRYRKYKQTSYQ